ncbi:hypothetical protein ACFTXM_20975 [Streptomyces sp. NPDC056930]|uniref:hypothetical protein n=1 Tax=Streptomyces sp. NPDC056930 TaxID=3345967 RepID=UPI0036265C3D
MTDDEDRLRRGLRDLAQGDAPAGGAMGVETLLAKGRRARAHRRGAAVACAVVLTVAGAGLGLRATGPGPRTPDSRASVAAVPADRPLKLGPAQPRIGVSYPYDLVVSCDLRFAVFDGSKWVTDTDLASNIALHGDRVSGVMTLVSKDVARFEFGSGSMRETADFRRVTGGGHCPLLPPANPAKPPVLEQSPANAVEGFWYPHDLYVHCGLRFTGFDGRRWVTVRDYSKETDIYESGRSSIVTGFIQFTGGRARFESPGLKPIEFRPAKKGEEPPFRCA